MDCPRRGARERKCRESLLAERRVGRNPPRKSPAGSRNRARKNRGLLAGNQFAQPARALRRVCAYRKDTEFPLSLAESANGRHECFAQRACTTRHLRNRRVTRRNLLIYFNSELQHNVAPVLPDASTPGRFGFLPGEKHYGYRPASGSPANYQKQRSMVHPRRTATPSISNGSTAGKPLVWTCYRR